MAYPVVTVRMPAGLAGVQNGKLPASLLTPVALPGRPTGAQLYTHAARAFTALAAQVKETFGHDLTVTSVADAYRTYERQVIAFKARYTTTPIAGRPTKKWDGVTYWQKPGTAMSAVPGTSNHGLGLAIDACYWENDNILGITSHGVTFVWIVANAARYGFSWEAQSEPWHLRYVAGDAIPQAVLDHEAPPPAPGPGPTPPDEEDDDMAALILVRTDDGQMYATNDCFTFAYPVSEEAGGNLRDVRHYGVGLDSGPHPLNALDSEAVRSAAGHR